MFHEIRIAPECSHLCSREARTYILRMHSSEHSTDIGVELWPLICLALEVAVRDGRVAVVITYSEHPCVQSKKLHVRRVILVVSLAATRISTAAGPMFLGWF